jgi:hypothetical protein
MQSYQHDYKQAYKLFCTESCMQAIYVNATMYGKGIEKGKVLPQVAIETNLRGDTWEGMRNEYRKLRM